MKGDVELSKNYQTIGKEHDLNGKAKRVYNFFS